MNAPAIAMSVTARRSRATAFLSEKYPASKKGSAITPHRMHRDGGRKPSMMCMAPAVGTAPHKSAAQAVSRTSFRCFFVIFSPFPRKTADTKIRRIPMLPTHQAGAERPPPPLPESRADAQPAIARSRMRFHPKRQVFWLGRPCTQPVFPGLRPSDVFGGTLFPYSGGTAEDLHLFPYSPAGESGRHLLVSDILCRKKQFHYNMQVMAPQGECLLFTQQTLECRSCCRTGSTPAAPNSRARSASNTSASKGRRKCAAAARFHPPAPPAAYRRQGCAPRKTPPCALPSGRKIHIMRGDQECAPLVRQAGEHMLQAFLARRVERRGRFVQQDDFALHRQNVRDGHALFLPRRISRAAGARETPANPYNPSA